MAAFGSFLGVIVSLKSGFGDTSGWPLILPGNANGNYQAVSGIFYPYLPDLPIARMMFLAGIAVAALGVLGLPVRAGSPGLRRAAAMVTLAGVAAAGTASVLVRTARLTPQGIAIPALHDAANDRPIGFTPVCGHAAGVPVCVNPAYRRYLPEMAADLRPVLAEVSGLPGAPIRVAQVAGRYVSGMFEDQNGVAVTISGTPPVLRVPLDTFNTLPSPTPGSAMQFDRGVAAAVGARVRRGQRRRHGGAAGGAGGPAAARRHAVRRATPGADHLRAAELGGSGPSGTPGGSTSGSPAQSPAGPVYAGARRFAALPASARHAWLDTHLAALRSGQFTLGQLP